MRFDQAGGEQPGDEGAGAGERVQDLHAGVGDPAAQVPVQGLGDGAQDEVDDFDGGVDDAEGVSGFGQGGFEEPFVQFGHDLLPAGVVVDAFGA